MAIRSTLKSLPALIVSLGHFRSINAYQIQKSSAHTYIQVKLNDLHVAVLIFDSELHTLCTMVDEILSGLHAFRIMLFVRHSLTACHHQFILGPGKAYIHSWHISSKPY